MNANPNERLDRASKTGFAPSTQMTVATAVMWCVVTAGRLAGTGHLPTSVGWLCFFLVIPMVIAYPIYFFTHVYKWDYTPRLLSNTEARISGGAATLTAVLACVNAYLIFSNWSHSNNGSGSTHQ
jgi:hypothetical protein